MAAVCNAVGTDFVWHINYGGRICEDPHRRFSHLLIVNHNYCSISSVFSTEKFLKNTIYCGKSIDKGK